MASRSSALIDHAVVTAGTDQPGTRVLRREPAPTHAERSTGHRSRTVHAASRGHQKSATGQEKSTSEQDITIDLRALDQPDLVQAVNSSAHSVRDEFGDDEENEKPSVEADLDLLDLDEEAVSTDPVRAYLTEIGRTALLDAAEEVELAKRIEAGLFAEDKLRQINEGGLKANEQLKDDLRTVVHQGREAKAHMLRANLRLVVSVAKKHSHRGLPFLDVVQEGNLGLIRAVEKFDYVKGYKFSTYAMWWIRQAISRGLAEQARTIRLPVHVAEDVNKLGRISRDLSQDLGREPTLEELSSVMELPLDRVAELRRVSRDTMSLDSPVGDDGDATLGDLVVESGAPAAAEAVEQRMLTAQVGQAVDALLPAREATILRLRYGLDNRNPCSLEEIGRHLGLTRERIRQLEKEALGKLRASRDEQLLEFAG